MKGQIKPFTQAEFEELQTMKTVIEGCGLVSDYKQDIADEMLLIYNRLMATLDRAFHQGMIRPTETEAPRKDWYVFGQPADAPFTDEEFEKARVFNPDWIAMFLSKNSIMNGDHHYEIYARLVATAEMFFAREREKDTSSFDGMSIHEIRIHMTTLGWSSEDRLSDIGWGEGTYGYGIWFERFDWHGEDDFNKVCIHAHTSDPSEARELVVRTAKKCLKAWADFPDKVPHMMGDGSLRPKPESLQPEKFQDVNKGDKSDE